MEKILSFNNISRIFFTSFNNKCQQSILKLLNRCCMQHIIFLCVAIFTISLKPDHFIHHGDNNTGKIVKSKIGLCVSASESAFVHQTLSVSQMK